MLAALSPVTVASAHRLAKGWPGTRRYEELTTYGCAANSSPWAALCGEARGGTAWFEREPIWCP